jgi:hypothetical protein
MQIRSARRSLSLLASASVAVASLLAVADASAIEENEKAGPFAANLKMGPAIKASTASFTQFAMQLEAQYAIIDGAGYIGFAPQFQFGNATTIVLPATFQYDIHLPVENLYIYPRIQAGVAIIPDGLGYGAFALQPEVGVKYQFHENFHAMCEPVSLPMYFGDPVFLQYRVYFGAGADF